jgi:hypothetical protein
MFTNLGDNILIDVERYDLDPELKPFNGLVDKVVQNILNGTEITEEDKKRYAVQIVGVEHVPTRALESIRDIGRSLMGRPQFYSTVSISAGLASYVVRQIALGGNLPTGRYFYSLADVFNQPRLDLKPDTHRQQILQAMSHKPPIKKSYVEPPKLDRAFLCSAIESRQNCLPAGVCTAGTLNSQHSALES